MQNQRSVAFHTLGCKLNFSESSAIARLFESNGFAKRKFHEPADVYVINTCSVTENADRECRSIVRNALQLNPEAFVAVIGCYAQLKPAEIAAIEGVDVVLGASEKFKLLNYVHLSGKNKHAVIHNCDVTDVRSFENAYSIGDRTRSFLKVQDGCDYSCTFCTIPQARGMSRSDTLENVLRNAQTIAEAGVKEIVLTGVNIGDFGYGEPIADSKKKKLYSFSDLVEQLDLVDGIERFRISSIEPNLLDEQTIHFVSISKRFVPHFHMPLQSGSDAILRLMKRRYLSSLYRERVETIKKGMPDCCIGVDVIVGFPGESEEHFLETYRFLNELPVSYLHVFTYSERDNTEAAVMGNVVPIQERKRRNKMLRILSAKKLRAFYESQKGKTYSVLVEHENKSGYMFGFTPNYVKVKLPFDEQLSGQLVTVTLGDFDEEGHLTGTLLHQEVAS